MGDRRLLLGVHDGQQRSESNAADAGGGAGAHAGPSSPEGKGLCSSSMSAEPKGRIRDQHESCPRAGSSIQDSKELAQTMARETREVR